MLPKMMTVLLVCVVHHSLAHNTQDSDATVEVEAEPYQLKPVKLFFPTNEWKTIESGELAGFFSLII